MPHRHRVRDIAHQAHLSEATVDRVLHNRPGVSARARRAVDRAIADLDRQAGQVRLTGRHLVLDLVMQAPHRFSGPVRAALEAEAATRRPAVVRIRPHLDEAVDDQQCAELLRRLRERGSDGVVLKGPDTAVVRSAVDDLVTAGVPVVTLATDLTGTRRHVSVGLDHASAGRTAAYLLDLAVRAERGSVLVPLSRAAFAGEGQRARAFTDALALTRPAWSPVLLDGSDGLDATMAAVVGEAVTELEAPIIAVYSVGGGNRGLLAALEDRGIVPDAFIAHDIDDDNRELLRAGRLTAVLHHDLRIDARRTISAILQLAGLVPGSPVSRATPVGIITPHNTDGV
ncbi:MAG: LacI family DNA-binding transcriptional regulator [Mobilicoccus sp.]|nr:LacI family DNA-binding transcriptional regulator [Mobilicoccus sp.]